VRLGLLAPIVVKERHKDKIAPLTFVVQEASEQRLMAKAAAGVAREPATICRIYTKFDARQPKVVKAKLADRHNRECTNAQAMVAGVEYRNSKFPAAKNRRT
jgi:hypothetical protein